MRRITKFLLSLLAFAGAAAYAQTTLPFEVSGAPGGTEWAANTTWYYVQLKKDGCYLSAGSGYTASDGSLMLTNSTKPSDDYGKWCLVGNDADGYKFYNKASGVTKALGMTADQSLPEYQTCAKMVAADGSDATYVLNYDFVASQCGDGWWVPKEHGTENRCWNRNGNYNGNYQYLVFWNDQRAITGWTGSGGDDGSAFKFEACPAVEYTVTYNYTVDGKVVETKTVKVGEGEQINAAAPSNGYLTAGTPDKTGAVTEDITVNIPCTVNLPFTVSESVANAHWYVVKIKNINYWKAADDHSVPAPVLPGSSVDGSEIDDAWLWCVTGNFADGYQFHNKKAGSGYTLCRPDLSAAGEAKLSAESANNLFIPVPARGVTNAACFYVKGDAGKMYINVQGALATSGTLLGWDDNDAGSAVQFLEPFSVKAGLVKAYALAHKDYVAATPSTNLPEGAITAGNNYLADASNLDAYQASYNAIVANETEANFNELVTRNKAVEAGEYGLEEGVYYRLQCVSPKAKDTNGDFSVLSWDSNAPSDYVATVETATAKAQAASVWQFVKSGSYYKLKNVNTGKYLEEIVNASNKRLMLKDEASAGKAAVSQYSDAAGHFQIRGSGWTTGNKWCLFAENGTGDNHRVSVWQTDANGASAWYIIKATELEVALNTVNGKSYASLYAPFPVQAGAGVSIYTGKLNGSTLEMESQTAVPANTGVVLVGAQDAATATLTIGGAAEAVTGNALTGTLLPLTTGIDNYYILSKGDTSGEIGFYPHSASLTTIRANKALLNKPTTGEDTVTLSFGGNPTTGIATALGAEAGSSAPVYDLSGRSVSAPAKGGVYIQGSRKFVVK